MAAEPNCICAAPPRSRGRQNLSLHVVTLHLQDWLESHGLDASSTPHPRSSTLETIHRRQQAAGGRASSSAAVAAAVGGHVAAPGMQTRQQQQAAQGEVQLGGAEGAARLRDGKRAYLRALPQLATAGPAPRQVRPLACKPAGRCLPCCLGTPASARSWRNLCTVQAGRVADSIGCLHLPSAAAGGAALPLLEARGLGGSPPAPGGTSSGSSKQRHRPPQAGC